VVSFLPRPLYSPPIPIDQEAARPPDPVWALGEGKHYLLRVPGIPFEFMYSGIGLNLSSSLIPVRLYHMCLGFTIFL
jgi:hypothetical protein